MSARGKYKKKPSQPVTAVQLDLETDGFTYEKWGGKQVCQRGDWLVDTNGDIYTVSEDSFAATYERVSAGRYVKTAPVWAEVARDVGKVETKEGPTHYEAGDYIVSNNEDGSDAYAISKVKFEEMYELADVDS